MRLTHDRPFKKLLIANRGEIAVRIIRAAKQLGIHTRAAEEASGQIRWLRPEYQNPAG